MKYVVVVAAIHKIIHSMILRGVLFGADINRIHNGKKSSVPLSLLHQSSWKFSVYSYLGLAALLPEYHHLLAVIGHVNHSLRGRHDSPSKFYEHSQMFCNVEFYKVDIVVLYAAAESVSFPLQKPCTKYMSAYSSLVNVLGILTMTTVQHSTAQHSNSSLDSVPAGTPSSYSSSSSLH
jgi:hypothetical protein